MSKDVPYFNRLICMGLTSEQRNLFPVLGNATKSGYHLIPIYTQNSFKGNSIPSMDRGFKLKARPLGLQHRSIMRIISALFAICFLANISAAYSQGKSDPHVILISLDGFRYDYVERFQPENLKKFIADGVAANSLIPSFPSKTFPNHYTIATGMRPEKHGIVDNSFYSAERNTEYKINKREEVTDGTWYAGTPLWVLAEQNGMKAASYFFVGSEAAIQDVRPTYYYDYDGSVNNLTRVSKVFEWLQLPDSLRPRMITMYFSDMDDLGHRFGPSNDLQLSTRLNQLDRELGALFEGVKSLDLDVNIIIVSDHGMKDVSLENRIPLENLLNGVKARVVNSGALAHIYLEDPSQKAKVLDELSNKKGAFKVVDPIKKEYYKDLSSFGDRIGDILILADLGSYLVDTEAYLEVVARRMRIDQSDLRGEHGFSSEYPEMHGIFYANGPQIHSKMTINSFDNIHIYPLICKVLGLPVPEEVQGELSVLEPILKY